jgi:hypothetical protein
MTILLILCVIFLAATVITGIYAVKLGSGGLGWLCFCLLLATFEILEICEKFALK